MSCFQSPKFFQISPKSNRSTCFQCFPPKKHLKKTNHFQPKNQPTIFPEKNIFKPSIFNGSASSLAFWSSALEALVQPGETKRWTLGAGGKFCVFFWKKLFFVFSTGFVFFGVWEKTFFWGGVVGVWKLPWCVEYSLKKNSTKIQERHVSLRNLSKR